MAFFENLGKKVGEVAQTAAKKSGELVEVTKLNMSIGSEEDKIQRLYSKMGKKIYEEFCSGGSINDGFIEECKSIKGHEQTIDSLKQKIREIKNVEICGSCGAEIIKPSAFCPKCGVKLEVEKPPAQQKPQRKACPSCSAEIAEDAVFCTSCGAKTE